MPNVIIDAYCPGEVAHHPFYLPMPDPPACPDWVPTEYQWIGYSVDFGSANDTPLTMVGCDVVNRPGQGLAYYLDLYPDIRVDYTATCTMTANWSGSWDLWYQYPGSTAVVVDTLHFELSGSASGHLQTWADVPEDQRPPWVCCTCVLEKQKAEEKKHPRERFYV